MRLIIYRTSKLWLFHLSIFIFLYSTLFSGHVIGRAVTKGRCGIPSVPHSRIIGGDAARPGAWPWHVGIYMNNTTFKCGGSLIAPRWVLTAAHCTQTPHRYRVVVGGINKKLDEKTEQSYFSQQVFNHPGFSFSTAKDDIALIYLDGPVKFNQYVKPVCLPRHGERVLNGTGCYVTGWGLTGFIQTTDVLQQVKLPVLDKQTCKQKLSASGLVYNLTDGMLCAGKPKSIKSACYGDSGGPYVCPGRGGRWVVQGVVSWGSDTCDTEQMYSVFTRVSQYRELIDRVMRAMG